MIQALAQVLPGQDIHNLLDTSGIPEEEWNNQDDLCDCTFQRIAWFTNPYIGRTMEVRLCCVWAELLKDYPQFIREIPAFDNYEDPHAKAKDYEIKPRAWAGNYDMPRAIWYRQMAVETGMSLDQVRNWLKNEEPPKAVKNTDTGEH